MKKAYLIFWISVTFLFTGVLSGAQETSKATDKAAPPVVTVPEETFSGNLDAVWENLVEVLKGYDFPIANSDKSAGTLNTVTRRYFKILSAKFPPVQQDYRDSYAIKVIAVESSTKVQIQRKFETYDHHTQNWVEGDHAKEKAGITVESIFEALRHRLTQAKKP